MIPYLEDWNDDNYDLPRYGGEDGYYDSERDDEDWSCAFPDECLMAYTDHMRDECHTAEMYEEYARGVE
jgi:hypothetical protein